MLNAFCELVNSPDCPRQPKAFVAAMKRRTHLAESALYKHLNAVGLKPERILKGAK